MKKCAYYRLSRVDYEKGLEIQKRVFEDVLSGNAENVLLLLEHNPVITLGRGGKKTNLLADESYLEKQGIKIHRVERGGDITYHGPGQIVGYPVLNLNGKRDIHLLVRSVEEVLIRVLEYYRIKSLRLKGLTGVWVNNEKVAAIGMAVKKWISFHGFAFNVSTDMTPFGFIRPCGIEGKGVTSMQMLLGENTPVIDEVEKNIIKSFGDVFDFEMENGDNKFLMNMVKSELSI